MDRKDIRKAAKIVFCNLMLVVFLLTSLFMQTGVAAAPKLTKTIRTGDYVAFGKYNSERIIWRVIHINGDKSLLLCSDKILTFKPYDAAESGITARADKASKTDPNRQRYGSNSWMNSNLREWLNSSEKRVAYSTRPPVKNAVYGKVNSYADEPGFLYNFTASERNRLMTMKMKDILPKLDVSGNSLGREVFESIQQSKGMLANYDNSYYRILDEKVSMLGVKEIHDYFLVRGWEYRKAPTQAAMKKSGRLWNNKTIKELFDNSSKKFWFYWLRTPSAQLSSTVRIIDSSGDPVEIGANNGSCGVVPVITLKTGVKAASGKGKLTDPFILAY